MKTTSTISPVEEYINSQKTNTREVGIQIKKHSKDVGTQTYMDDDTLFSRIEPYKLDEDYMTKMDMEPYGLDYYDDDYAASVLIELSNQKK